jgi:hypothetical protein
MLRRPYLPAREVWSYPTLWTAQGQDQKIGGAVGHGMFTLRQDGMPVELECVCLMDKGGSRIEGHTLRLKRNRERLTPLLPGVTRKSHNRSSQNDGRLLLPSLPFLHPQRQIDDSHLSGAGMATHISMIQ